jgi:hypothetical protein
MAEIWRVSFIEWVGNRDLVAEGPEGEVREAVHPFLEAKMAQGFSLADLLPWLDWERVEA